MDCSYHRSFGSVKPAATTAISPKPLAQEIAEGFDVGFTNDCSERRSFGGVKRAADFGDVGLRGALGLLALLLVGWPGSIGFAGQTVVVVLDDSGSMDKTMDTRVRRMAAAKQSLASVLRSLNYDTKVGIITLNSTVKGSHWVVPVGSPDADRWAPLLEQIRAKGGTPLGQYIKEGADELLRLRAKEPFETYRLLIVTDGEASDAPYLASILPDLVSRGISMDVIGVAMKEQHSLAKSAHTYRSADDPATLTAVLGDVFAETGSGTDQTVQADFDLISGMPDDVASEVVKRLSAPRNDPISDDTPAWDGSLASASPGPNAPAMVPNATNTTTTAPENLLTSAIRAVVSTICCFGGFCFVFLVVVAIVLNAVKNHTKS